MKRFYLLLLLVVATGFNSYSQKPYDFSGRVDGPLLGLGGITYTTAKLIGRKVPPLTEQEKMALRIDEIPGIDRWSTRQQSHTAKSVSDKLLYTSLLLPLTLLADQPSRGDMGSVGLLYFETLIVNNGLTDLTKALVKRERPYLYNPAFSELTSTREARFSFFSGHTSNSAAMSFLTAQMYTDYYPDSKGHGVAWALAALIPAVTGYNRMRAGKHFFTDVLVGYVVGAAVGMLVPRLH